MLWLLLAFVGTYVRGKELNDSLLISSEYGLIQGQMIGNARAFRAIPYAKPPIDQLRWAPPQQPIPWGNDPYQATHDPPGCPQRCYLPPMTCPPVMDEDCLYLNVFAPMSVDTLHPVLVFIHGGNFKQGYGGGMLYNGTNFVNYTDVVIVTMNYRLGVLGSLWSAIGPDGNYAFKDQMLALEFIRDNIANFGGDPTKITLFGQSAGAVSIALHMMRGDTTLFHSAVMHSEPFGIPIRDVTTWGDLPTVFYRFLGCDYDRFHHNPTDFWMCLRNKTVSDVLSAQMATENDVFDELPDHLLDLFMPWTPTAGTDLILQQPIWAFQKGNYIDIPFIIGNVANEGVNFIWMAYPNGLSREQVDAAFVELLGPKTAARVRAHYPLPDNTTDYRLYTAKVASDGLFRCPSRNISIAHLTLNQFKTDNYFYHFDHVGVENNIIWGPNYTECWNYVCHGADLQYIFHPNLAPIGAHYTAEEHELGFSMQTYWSQFADVLKPNGGTRNHGSDDVQWIPFILGTEPSLSLQAGDIQMQDKRDLVESQCDFWDTTNYDWIR